MTQALLFRLQDGKIRILEEAVESWKRGHQQALLALDMEDLLAECLSCWEDNRRAWLRTRKLATLHRISDLQEAGATMLDQLDRAIRVLRDVAGLARNVAHDTGRALEGSESLTEAIRESSDLREHVNQTWPWQDRPILPLDRTMAEASRAARARGESRDVGDILASL